MEAKIELSVRGNSQEEMPPPPPTVDSDIVSTTKNSNADDQTMQEIDATASIATNNEDAKGPKLTDNTMSPDHHGKSLEQLLPLKERELPPLCSSSEVFGPLPGDHTQTSTVAFPPLRPVREIDRTIREQILDLNISVLFDYADKDYSGIVSVADFIVLLRMIDTPEARLRLEKLIVEIKQHQDGIDPATFKFFFLKCCTTDSRQRNDIDEAAVGLATLLKNIRQHERSNRRKRVARQSERNDIPGRPIISKRSLNTPLRPRSRIARIPSTVHDHIESKQSRMEQHAEVETTGVTGTTAAIFAALMQSSEGVRRTCWRNCARQMIFVDQMHIPMLAILLWLVVGTLCYFFVQGWSLAQSFYFMVQAGLSVGFGAFSEDLFVGQDQPDCVQIYDTNSWDWLAHLKENETYPLSEATSTGKFDVALGYNGINNIGHLEPRYIEICPKWPWTFWRSSLSKVLSTLFIFLGSMFSGWLISLVGEDLVAKRTTWYEEQEELERKKRAEIHREAATKISAKGVTRDMSVRDESKDDGEDRRCSVDDVVEWLCANGTLVTLGIWVLFGIIFSMAVDDQDIFSAIEFAVSAISTGGLQAPENIDDKPTIAIVGIYVLFGVPFYALALGQIAGYFMAGREAKQSQEQQKDKGSVEGFKKALEYLGGVAGKMQGSRLDFNRYMMWELLRMGKIEYDLLKQLRERFNELDIGGDGWIDIEEFNMVLTFDKFKHADDQLGLRFSEFEKMVGALLDDHFVISKFDAYKTPANAFLNELHEGRGEQAHLSPQERAARVRSELRKQFDAFANGSNVDPAGSKSEAANNADPQKKYLTIADFFEWTHAHSVVKLHQSTDGEDELQTWMHMWQMFCEKYGMTSDSEPSSVLTSKTFDDPEKAGTAQREEFSVLLATFLLEYNQDTDASVAITFMEGEWVEIINESSKKGWRARVTDPNWHGLVRVKCVGNDGRVRAFERQHLRKLPLPVM